MVRRVQVVVAAVNNRSGERNLLKKKRQQDHYWLAATSLIRRRWNIVILMVSIFVLFNGITVVNFLSVTENASSFLDTMPSPPKRPSWCLEQKAKNESEQVYLGAVLVARIWPHTDLANLTFEDVAHWMTYQRYAGVERIYYYDTYHNASLEQTTQHPAVQAGIDSNFIQYVDYHDQEMLYIDPKTGKEKGLHRTIVQKPAYIDYQHRVNDQWNNSVVWSTFTDMDEYVYSPTDLKSGFLKRFLQNHDPDYFLNSNNTNSTSTSKRGQPITQWTLPNIIAHGGRNPRLGPMLIQQVPRISVEKENELSKYIVKMEALKRPDIHGATTKYGKRHKLQETDHPINDPVTNNETLHMRHYWGGRTTKWKLLEDMSDDERRAGIVKKTIENNMTFIAHQILKCF